MPFISNRANSINLTGRHHLAARHTLIQGAVKAPELPRRYYPKADDKLVSFVIKSSGLGDSDDQNNMLEQIHSTFSSTLAAQYPEVNWAKDDVWQELEKWQSKGRRFKPKLFVSEGEARTRSINNNHIGKNKVTVKLEPLFPRALQHKKSQLFGLEKYFLLRLPIYEKQLSRKTGKKQLVSMLRETGYIIAIQLKSSFVAPATSYPNYFSALSIGTTQTALPKDKDWPRKAMQATKLNVTGRGSVIGHPDSGWTPHELLNFDNNQASNSLDINNDWNVFNDANSAEESLSSLAANKYHGTATASLMVSKLSSKIRGLAPDAKVLPIRCLAESAIDTGVVLIGDIDVARACWHAIEKGVHIPKRSQDTRFSWN